MIGPAAALVALIVAPWGMVIAIDILHAVAGSGSE